MPRIEIDMDVYLPTEDVAVTFLEIIKELIEHQNTMWRLSQTEPPTT